MNFSLAKKFVLVAMALGVVAQCMAQDILIDLGASVKVSERLIRLGDIADISAPPQFLNALRALTIGEAPRPGEIGFVGRREIIRVMRQQFGTAWMKSVSLIGAAECKVVSEGQAFSTKPLFSYAEEHLVSQLENGGYKRVSVVEAGYSRPVIQLPKGNVSWRYRGPGQIELPFRKLTVWFDLYVEGARVSSVPMTVKVSAYLPALVVRRDLLPGQFLTAADLNLTEVDVSALAAPPLLSVGDNVRATGRLRTGSVLVKRDVEDIPDVIRGQRVQLSTKNGAVELLAVAEALADGYAGQEIRVRTVGAHTSLQALVVEKGKVMLLP